MTACASSPPPSSSTPVPASLRQPCPQLPKPARKDGAAMFLWAREAIRLYNDCASRHQALADAVKE